MGYSPSPGAVRVLPASELSRLALRNGIAAADLGALRDVCFQRDMRDLDPKALIEVLRRTLDIPGSEIEIADFSRYLAPAGDLVFPRSGLALNLSATSGALFWKGYVVYGEGQHFSIWARVKIHAKFNRVVATDNLTTHAVVRPDQVRVEFREGVPDTLAPAQSLDEVVGKTLVRPIRRGGAVSRDDVTTAIVVRRGDKVDVDFTSSAMHLRFEAAAESDGHMGDRIRLRNPQSGNMFSAEVSGKDQARVVTEN